MKPWGWMIAALILSAAAGCAGEKAQESGPATLPSAAEEFRAVLDGEGLEAALERLREVLADTTAAWEVNDFELVVGLPNELILAGRREEALALIRATEPNYGYHPRYWIELANACLKAGRTEEARAAFLRSDELEPGQPQLPWTLANLDRLAETIEQQLAAEGRWRPGEQTGLQGPYCGQTPPGRVPEVFAPGLVCGLGHEYSISFGPDGREIVFSRSGVGTMICRWEPDGWTAPQELILRGEEYLDEEASLTPDGRMILFCSRPRDMSAEREVWVAERRGAGWGEPRRLFTGMYPTAALDGTIYVTGIGGRPDHGVIERRRPVGDGYGEPEALEGAGINTPAPDAHPWIFPDQSLLLFDSYREPDPGLYVSFRTAEDEWSEAVCLNESLGIPPAGQAALSHDGKYLFFCLAGDMYWVDASFLEDLRPR